MRFSFYFVKTPFFVMSPWAVRVSYSLLVFFSGREWGELGLGLGLGSVRWIARRVFAAIFSFPANLNRNLISDERSKIGRTRIFTFLNHFLDVAADEPEIVSTSGFRFPVGLEPNIRNPVPACVCSARLFYRFRPRQVLELRYDMRFCSIIYLLSMYVFMKSIVKNRNQADCSFSYIIFIPTCLQLWIDLNDQGLHAGGRDVDW